MITASRILILAAAWLAWAVTAHADTNFEKLPVAGGLMLID